MTTATKTNNSNTTTTTTTTNNTTTTANNNIATKTTKAIFEPNKDESQVIFVEGKTYNRKFTISKAYLDLKNPEGVRPSLHKFIHDNRILIFTLILLYITIDGKNHGFNKLLHHLSYLEMIFINPVELLIGLTVMYSLSFLIPLFNYLYQKNKFNKWLFKNDNKVALFIWYAIVQLIIGCYLVYYILYRRSYPLGTQFYLGLIATVLSWKQHSYFIVTNYETLHHRNVIKNDDDKEYNKKLSTLQINYKDQFNTLFDYFKDYFHFIFTPTLIYDQYFEVKKASLKLAPVPIKTRIISLLKELYSSLAIMITAHYINVEYIFPALTEKLDIYSYIKILIPAEINFQLQYYLLYHCAMCLIADITGFNDRLSFYNNYWDSVTTREILTQWSKPVHNWLYRHMLSDMKSFFKIRSVFGLFITMIFSGFFHEVIVTSITKQVCMPWSTFSLVNCAIFILIENKYPKLANSVYYHAFVRILLVVGHGLFYFSYFYFCFSDYDISRYKSMTCPKL